MINVPWVAFNGGEIGEETLARVDLPPYPTTCAVMENCWALLQGPLTKVPGTEYIGRTYQDQIAILRPFIFNVDQTRVLEITDSRIAIVDGNAYVDIDGAAATIGTPVDNGSSGGSSVSVSGQNVTFTASSSGVAAAYWPITSGVNGTPVTFRFEIERRPLGIRVGSSTSGEDILAEITLYPGVHILSFTPNAASYFIRARLQDQGKAVLKGLTRLAAGEFAIPTPWLEADLPGLRYRQSLDTFWLYHPDYRTRVLERRANTSWSLRLFRPENGPFDAPNTTDVTLTPSATAGTATVLASEAQFSAGSIGQLVEITHRGQYETVAATAVDNSSDSIRVFGAETSRNFQVAISGTFVGTIKLQRSAGNELDWQDVASYTAVTTATINDELDNQIIYYRLICSAYTSGTINGALTYSGGETTGRGEITVYNSPTSVEVEIYEDFGAITPTTNWSLGAWSDDLGWPAAGTLDDGRHLLVRDDLFWASEADDYEAFQIGVDAADAIARRYGSGGLNAGRWIEGGKRVMIGTAGEEFDLGSSALEERITPDNLRLKTFGENGSANAQACRVSDSRVVFIDRTRVRLMQCLYDEDSASDQFTTDDLTAMHEDVAGEFEEAAVDDVLAAIQSSLIADEDNAGGFVEIAFQKRPQPRVWAVRADGQIGVILFDPRRGVYAWNRITGANDGLFRSVCVVPARPEDRVHVMVEREIDGETRLYHERLALQKFPVVTTDGRRTAPMAWRLQCALSSTGAAADTFSGLDHLEGEEVSIWADGRVHPNRTVESGAITLDWEAETVIIGLNYVGKWKSSKLAYGAQLGTALTMDKKVTRLGFVVRDTPVGAVKYGRDFDHCDDQLRGEFEDEQLMDAAVTLWSKEDNQSGEWATDMDARVCVIMDTPAPVTILAMVPGMDLEERK